MQYTDSLNVLETLNILWLHTESVNKRSALDSTQHFFIPHISIGQLQSIKLISSAGAVFGNPKFFNKLCFSALFTL